MSAFERLKREKLIEMVTDGRDFEEVENAPHNEEQPFIDHLERPVYDEDDLQFPMMENFS